MRFLHLGDTHIRNYKYHKEYRAVFGQLFDKAREQKPDFIIHCGDIAHTKTQLSPEYFELATEFLSGLAAIAPTYVILGNHDGNLKNDNRQDAITPIVNALQNPNLILLKNSQEVKIADGFYLNALSVFDEQNWSKPSNPEAVNIALYHGSISGVKTDIGWTMEQGDHSISIFDDFDYAFLGDIHKTNQALDKNGKVRYPGSTVQQNFGETNDKGYLLWDIEDKDNFECHHIQLDNPKPFITIALTEAGRIPKNFSAPSGARLRLMSNNNLTVQQMHRAAEIVKEKFKPESITFASRASGERGDIDKFSSDLQQEDLRDPVVIEKLMKEYLKDYDMSDDLLQKVYDLNRKYTSIVQEGEEVSRNVNWQMKSLSWDNLFNYGDNNHINFEKLNGVVGIFGKNFSGKSSIIDSLLFTIFNTTSKNERKNLNVINQDKQTAKCAAEIVVNNNTYKIEREISKYTKKLKGQETLEAKVDLNFAKTDNTTGESENLNGLSRNETDANIRRVFGTIDDFLNTSLSSQLDSLSFIREGSTKRKEILANFLDLDVFEKKFKAAKEDSVELKGALRRIGDRDFDKEIKEASEALFQSEKSLILKQSECRQISEAKAEFELSIKELQTKIDSAPTEPIDIKAITANIGSNEQALASKESLLSESRKSSSDKIALLQKLSSFVENFDQKDLIEKDQQLSAIGKSIGVLNETLKDIDKKQDLLNKVPCADAFPSCLFIKDAVVATKKKEDVVKDISDLQVVYDDLLVQKTAEKLKQLNDILDKKNKTEIEIRNLEISIGKLENEITKIKNDLADLYSKKKVYNDNREAIENLELLMQQKKGLDKQLADLSSEYKDCEDQINLVHRSIGSYEQKVADLKEQKEEIDNLRQEYAAYELFMRCMHSNGIAYDIIKKRLPIINEEIAKILANLTDFEAFFEEEGNKLEIFIRHSNGEPRPLSMASGAEKTMSAMAIRLALLSVSNLPKSDIMILDEPGTALDETHLQAFTQMLEMIKAKFRTVLLISHLEALKDVVDLTIEIDKKDGYALVSED